MITSAAIEMIPAQLDFDQRLRRDRLLRYRQTRSLRELCAFSMLISNSHRVPSIVYESCRVFVERERCGRVCDCWKLGRVEARKGWQRVLLVEMLRLRLRDATAMRGKRTAARGGLGKIHWSLTVKMEFL